MSKKEETVVDVSNLVDQIQDESTEQDGTGVDSFNVTIVKLSSGEELITEVHPKVIKRANGQEGLVVELVNPCVMVRNPQDDGRVNIMFAPLAPFYEGERIQIQENHIVWTGAPTLQFKETYLRRFDKLPEIEQPRIAVPERKLIIPEA